MTNAEAAAIIEQLRTMLAVDDDGPEGSMGPRWVVGQIRELVSGPSASNAATSNHPQQPLELVGKVVRFRKNRIVDWMLNALTHGERADLNRIASMAYQADWHDDYKQLMQLIGYSVSGYGEIQLGCTDAELDDLDRQADALLNARKASEP